MDGKGEQHKHFFKMTILINIVVDNKMYMTTYVHFSQKVLDLQTYNIGTHQQGSYQINRLCTRAKQALYTEKTFTTLKHICYKLHGLISSIYCHGYSLVCFLANACIPKPTTFVAPAPVNFNLRS